MITTALQILPILLIWSHSIQAQTTSEMPENLTRVAWEEQVYESEIGPQAGLPNAVIRKWSDGAGFMASIEKKTANGTDPICAGVILSPFVVISSFSCVNTVHSIADELQIRVGTLEAGEGGYLYNVYQSYGINYRLSKAVPKEETWGRQAEMHRDYNRMASVNIEEYTRKKAAPHKARPNSLNIPKVCEKSSSIDPFGKVQELFEAERFLGLVNPEYLILVTCEPIEQRGDTVRYSQMATYHGPFRQGQAYIMGFGRGDRKLRRTRVVQAVALECLPTFEKEYTPYKSGIVLDNRYVCVTDLLKSEVTTNLGGFCDSDPGSPIVIMFHGSILFQGVTLYARTCQDFVNPVMVRVFDNQASRTISQVIYE